MEWDAKYNSQDVWKNGSLVEIKPDDKRTHSDKNWSFRNSTSFFKLEKEANLFTTFIKLNNKNTLLHVKNIRGRVVVTLPKDQFDLISTRFYLGLLAIPQEKNATPVHGTLFFRQDQLHIDLFVFFSVFFSCFFLFLAGCVLVWKAKQAADLLRARRRHVVEMLHMAKRPFATVQIVLETEKRSNGISNNLSPFSWNTNEFNSCSKFETRPVAVEPTEDGLAGIVSFFVRLPGGSDAPIQLSVASCLVIISQSYNCNKNY